MVRQGCLKRRDLGRPPVGLTGLRGWRWARAVAARTPPARSRRGAGVQPPPATIAKLAWTLVGRPGRDVAILAARIPQVDQIVAPMTAVKRVGPALPALFHVHPIRRLVGPSQGAHAQLARTDVAPWPDPVAAIAKKDQVASGQARPGGPVHLDLVRQPRLARTALVAPVRQALCRAGLEAGIKVRVQRLQRKQRVPAQPDHAGGQEQRDAQHPPQAHAFTHPMRRPSATPRLAAIPAARP